MKEGLCRRSHALTERRCRTIWKLVVDAYANDVVNATRKRPGVAAFDSGLVEATMQDTLGT